MNGDSGPDDALLEPGARLPACDRRLVDLYRYWLTRRPAAGVLPGRQHLDPVDIPRLLQWIWLTEVQRNPLRFTYRLVGTVHVEVFGSDMTGRSYDEVHPAFRGSIAYPHFAAAAEHGRIAFYRGPPVYVIETPWKTIERLILPLARNGHDVDMLLGMTVLDPRSAPPLGDISGGRK